MPIGSIIGGVIGQQGAQQGGDMAWGAANQANQQNQGAANRSYEEARRARTALTPWTSLGLSSVNKLASLYGLGHTQYGDGSGDGNENVTLNNANWKRDQDQAYADFKTSPGYQFRLDQGTNALDRSAASRGMVMSGAQKQGVQDYAQGRASDEWGNYVNALSGFSGQGMGATESGNNTSAALYGQAGNLIGQGSNALVAGGTARGSAYERGANALASGINKGLENGVKIAAMAFGSDRDLKTDIQKIGKDPDTGLTIYAYRYKGDPKTYKKVVGPMADEMEEMYPGTTAEIAGKRVVTALGRRLLDVK